MQEAEPIARKFVTSQGTAWHNGMMWRWIKKAVVSLFASFVIWNDISYDAWHTHNSHATEKKKQKKYQINLKLYYVLMITYRYVTKLRRSTHYVAHII